MNRSQLNPLEFIVGLLERVPAETWGQLIAAILTFVVVYGALWVLKAQLLRRLEKMSHRTKIMFDDVILHAINGMSSIFLFSIALFVAFGNMDLLPPIASMAVRAFFLVMAVYESVKIGERIVLFFVEKRLKRTKEAKAASAAVAMIVRGVLWLVGTLLILSNLGVNIGSLLAGLGIGGLAISLALQSVFDDIFSFFSIVIDKPFEEGDFIIIGDEMGTVKNIGIKTTRIATLQGEELVMPNKELTTARLHNFRKLKERRIVFNVTVAYGTTPAQLKKIPGMVKDVVRKVKNVRFDRTHFTTMGDFSLDFEVVYFVKSAEYPDYLNAQQEINLGILRAFQKEKIEIPFPTRTVHVGGEA